MPILSMACPRCGKQSTEYEENKWQCLHCGNKFIIRDEKQSVNISNTFLQGDFLYDLVPHEQPNHILLLLNEPNRANWPAIFCPATDAIKTLGGCADFSSQT